MSVHTVIQSRFTNLNDVIQVLDRAGIKWKKLGGFFSEKLYNKATGGRALHAIEAIIGGEAVWIYQWSPGEPFTFCSKGHFFQNEQSVGNLAYAETPEETRARQLQKQQYAWETEQRSILEQQWREQHAKAAADQERRRRESAAEEQRRREQELSRQRAEEQRRAIEEQAYREKELMSIADESAQILERLQAEEQSRARETKGVQPERAPGMCSADTTVATDQRNVAFASEIGKLLQQNVKAKLLESMDVLQSNFGITMSETEIHDDGIIEITLRG